MGRFGTDAGRLGTALAVHLALMYVAADLALACGLPLSGAVPAAVAAASAAAGLALGWFAWRGRVLPAAGWAALTWVAAAAAMSAVMDASWDGQAYHQEAVSALRAGWNPFRGTYSGAWVLGPGAGFEAPSSTWVRHYPNGAWVLQAVVAGVTGSVASAKAWAAVAAVAALACSAATLGRLGLAAGPRWALAGAAALNPVTLVQMPSHYVDGACGSLLLLLVASLARLLVDGNRQAMAVAVAALAVALNLKFTMVPMAGVLCAGFCAMAAARHGWRRAAATAAPVAIACAVSLGTLGYAPYVLNAARHGNPFYPVAGAGSIDFMAPNTPRGIAELPRAARLPASVLSRTSNPAADGALAMKVPFTVKAYEIKDAGFVDARVGGFGPLFSGALLLALALSAALALPSRRVRGAAWGAAGAAVLLASALVHPEAWWARYVPQLWIMPLVPAALGFLSPGRWLRGTAVAVCAVMVANALACGESAAAHAYASNRAMAAQRDALLAARGPVAAYFGSFMGAYARLRDAGVPLRAVASKEDLPCHAPVPLAGTHGVGLACLPASP